MAVTHPEATRNAIAEVVRGIANAGDTPVLVIGTSSLALPSTGVLVEIVIPDFGAASGGVITSATEDLEEEATGSGTAEIAIVRSSGGTEAFRGAVGSGSGEVQISSTTIAPGDIVRLTSDLTWTAPP